MSISRRKNPPLTRANINLKLLPPYTFDQTSESRILVKPIEAWIDLEERHLKRAILECELKQRECLSPIAQTLCHKCHIVGCDVALPRNLLELVESPPRRVFLSRKRNCIGLHRSRK